MRRADLEATAAILRRVLALVDDGTLDASSPKAVALVRRIEGAAVALDAATARPSSARPL